MFPLRESDVGGGYAAVPVHTVNTPLLGLFYCLALFRDEHYPLAFRGISTSYPAELDETLAAEFVRERRARVAVVMPPTGSENGVDGSI